LAGVVGGRGVCRRDPFPWSGSWVGVVSVGASIRKQFYQMKYDNVVTNVLKTAAGVTTSYMKLIYGGI
jgi:hypothetical protein